MIKATVYVFKFVDKCKHSKGCLDYDHRAKPHLFKVMQEQAFVKAIIYLKNSKENNIPDRVRSLNLYVDSDRFVRTDGRIANTPGYEYSLIFPILIAKHFLTELIMNDCHNRCKHLDINATVTKLRMSGIWVPQARQAVKSVISKCFTCKKCNNWTLRYPKITNLPRHRVIL